MTISRSDTPFGYKPVNALSGLGQRIGPFYLKDGVSVDEDGVTRVGLKMEALHGGGPGRGHGGVTMTLLDEVMGRSATNACETFCVTITMNTNFCASTQIGDFLIARAKVSHKTFKTIFLEATIHAGDVLIATATGIWKKTKEPIPDEIRLYDKKNAVKK